MIGLRAWIPPLPFGAGIAFQAAAWVLVLVDASAPSTGVRLAWVHAVALGWLTLTALAVLLHVTPEFTDLRWRGEATARASLGVAVVAVAGLVAAFAANAGTTLAIAGGLAAVALLTYVLVALATLAQRPAGRTEAAIGRALAATLVALGATAVIGGGLARAFAVHDARMLALAPTHAWLGIGAWLTLLVSGVSTRTFRPMLGIPRSDPRVHIAVGSTLLVGTVLAAIGAPSNPTLLRVGAAAATCGALLYVGSTGFALRAATVPHLVPRAFVAASAAWLVLALIGTWATLLGVPLAAPVVVVALAGWLGQMVNAHLHHLGVRLLATLIRGDDDETRPWTVLTPQLGWLAFGCAQVAVAATAWRAAGGTAVAAWLGGCAGLAAIAALAANGGRAYRRLIRPELAGAT